MRSAPGEPRIAAEVRGPAGSAVNDRRSTLLLAAAGVALLFAYGAVASVNGFFVFSEFDYLRDKAVILYSFRQPQLASILWKIVLLFPASILIAMALVRSGVRFSLPWPEKAWKLLVPLMGIAGLLITLSITLVFRQTEMTDDENAYLFQARTLLLGRVVNPPPPVRKSFDNVFLINDGRQWTGKYSLGHPAVVALGLLAGSKYGMTVLVSVLSIVLVYGIARRLEWERRTALLAALLMAASPFFYLVSSSLLSHTTAGFALACFFALFLRARNHAGRPAGLVAAFAGGLALGLAFNIRPLTAVGYALPFGVLAASDLIARRRGTWTFLLSWSAGILVMAAATALSNQAVTGDPLLFPFTYYNPEERIGFGPYGHTPAMAVSNLAVSMVRLNSFLFGFPVSLLLAAVPFAFRMTTGDRLAAGIVGSLSAAYLFYWAPGVSDLGPVYYYEMLVPLVLLSARGAALSHGWLSKRLPAYGGGVPVFITISFVLSLLTFVPERLVHIRRLAEQVREPYVLLKTADVTNALVMVISTPSKGWVFNYRHPHPSLNEDVILCSYADRTSNLAVFDAFPDRERYVIWYEKQWERSVIQRVTRANLMTMPARSER